MLSGAMSMHLNTKPPDSASVDEIAEGLVSKTAAHAHTSVRVRPTRKPWITKEPLKLISYNNRMFKTARNNEILWIDYK